jgi:hypothetical protein
MWELLHNKTAQAFSGWIGIVSVVFTVLGKLTPEWFGHLSWPQAILSGIAAALGGSLVLSVILLLGALSYRYIRPLPVGAPSLFAHTKGGELTAPVNGAAAQEIAAPVRLTGPEKERCSVALAEINDFIGGPFTLFHTDIISAWATQGADARFAAMAAMKGRHTKVQEQAKHLSLALSYYLELMRLDFRSLVSEIAALAPLFDKVVQAKGWNEEAQRERAHAVVQTAGNLLHKVYALQREIPERRKEFIDG